MAGRGWDWRGRQGVERQARSGQARPGKARRGMERPAQFETFETEAEEMSNRRVREAKRFVLNRGVSVGGVSGQVIGDELTNIYDQQGKLTAPLVVESARPEDAPLHPVFEWDDEVAGELWREHEARNLIKIVRVEKFEDSGEIVTAPVFYHIPVSNHRSGEYHPTEVVVQTPDMLILALSELHRHMAAAEKSIQALRSAAEQKGDRDLNARISIAALAFEAAREAVAALH